MLEYVDKVIMVSNKIDDAGPWMWTKDGEAFWHIILHDWPHLKALWGKNISKYRVCVQAGGGYGMYPRLLAETFDRVYTFEPNPISFHCLVNNCQSENIYKYNAVLSDQNQIIKIKTKKLNNPGETRVSSEGDYSIPAITIDNLALDACDFIQLDVEEYELNVLKGAKNTIEKYNPVISCENGNDAILSFLNTIAPYKHVGSFAPQGANRSDDLYKVI